MTSISSDEINSYSRKSKCMMKQLDRLEEYLAKMEGGLEVVKVDTMSMPRWRHPARRRRNLPCPYTRAHAVEWGVQRISPRILRAQAIGRGVGKIEKGRSIREIEEIGGERRNHIEKEGMRGRLKGERRERRYEEPHHEIRRYFESPQRDEREVLRRAPMDDLKCHIPPFIGDGDMESYLDWEMKRLVLYGLGKALSDTVLAKCNRRYRVGLTLSQTEKQETGNQVLSGSFVRLTVHISLRYSCDDRQTFVHCHTEELRNCYLINWQGLSSS
ncbi:hypothetical protein CR513_09274, partial [Mucuna pruriens]